MTSMTAEDVMVTLARLFAQSGEPAYIRLDNSPEFIAEAIKRWLVFPGSRPSTLSLQRISVWLTRSQGASIRFRCKIYFTAPTCMMACGSISMQSAVAVVCC